MELRRSYRAYGETANQWVWVFKVGPGRQGTKSGRTVRSSGEKTFSLCYGDYTAILRNIESMYACSVIRSCPYEDNVYHPAESTARSSSPCSKNGYISQNKSTELEKSEHRLPQRDLELLKSSRLHFQALGHT